MEHDRAHCLDGKDMGTRNAAPKPAEKKRRLVLMESDTESGSDSDVILLGDSQQRVQDESKAAEDGRRLSWVSLDSQATSISSPTSDKDAGPSRRDFPCGGEPEFNDIAEVYGGQVDGLGENFDDDDDEDLGDSAFCAICDDGGQLLLCDGPCMRSFHASKESASGSLSRCRSLGLVEEDVQRKDSWYCANCKRGQHQCFICGRLGRSKGDKKEVFVCDVALCGRFYHPKCVGEWKRLEQFNGIADWNLFIRSVKEGKGFCCPAHHCKRCGEVEEGGVDDSKKLAKCRRCPKAFHKACLPKNISFKSIDGRPIRAWDIGARLLIYCLKHEIIPDLLTPARNHLTFPDPSLLHLKRRHDLEESQHKILKNPSTKHLVEVDELDKALSAAQKIGKRPVYRRVQFCRSDQKRRITFDKEADRTQPFFKVKHGEKEVNRTEWKKGIEEQNVAQSHDCKGKGLVSEDPNVPMMASAGLRTRAEVDKQTGPVVINRVTQAVKVPPLVPSIDVQKRTGSEIAAVQRALKKIPISREGQQHRIKRLLKQAEVSITLEDVERTLAKISCYGESKDKDHGHRGEILSTLAAGKKALDLLKNGGSTEAAKCLCTKDSLNKLLRTEKTLRVYLAPLVHGMRYTSFGRHFTHVDKLKEIVERIHPYIDSGDMVVDFCCGANDFSILLDKKLTSTGKSCKFKNYDIHPPKDTFCFTKGDWFKQDGRSFLEGRKLIMGLNPPFGCQASLADKFILHALSFRPKLLVLIVPPETMSFSERYKSFNYNLVWRDDNLLKGSSFYFPGSVDAHGHENMAQWNNVTPPLYLWSTGDMIGRHKQIALSCKHIMGSDVPGLDHRMEPPQQNVQRQGQVHPDHRSGIERPFYGDVRRGQKIQRNGGWGPGGRSD